MKKLYFIKNDSGQALVTLLFFIIIGMTIIAAAVVFVYENSQAASITEQGIYAYYAAEAGAQEALIRLLRDPNYTGTPIGQTLAVGSGNTTITVSNGLITSTGSFQNAKRKIQVQTVYNNSILTISSWKETN